MENSEQYTVCLDEDKIKLTAQEDDVSTTVLFSASGEMEEKMINERCSIYEKMERSFFGEKLVYVLSVTSVLVLTCSLTAFQWNIPYIYLILLTVTMPMRVYRYWQMKQQFFLLDWCYVSNFLLLIYIIGFPENGTFFTVVFGLSNGPVAWAILTFRNCLVLHSVERMTNLIIHILPMLVTYSIKWYPVQTGSLWVRSFSQTPMILTTEELRSEESLVWLMVLPLGVYMTHSILYVVLITGVVKPAEEYSNIYRYMSEPPGSLAKVTSCAGERFRPVVFLSLNGTYAALTLVGTWLWFQFHVAHILFVCLMVMIATYNGATFYLHPFMQKGLAADPYRVCGREYF
ncbi:glycerophosphocholine acyltransferase 1-like [Lytechinus variegatus]|uniref:glycerophosphocholine acyltransferase 1-like n=1 Tax=Lytechinus variegatus TaxID=7654 RepID=UPI001BB1C0B7|nr:glycerophosphocholine acyltransferase 1-like [Lytechinus variegatus]XP_041477725.1 glycerophosphocholine acyltransferase 1-like [Lytechinus variegatus]